MLKTSKILAIGFGTATVVMGSYIVYTNFFKDQQKKQEPVVKSTKVFDTVPEKDSSLDKLNRILADNNEAKNNVQVKNDFVLETYENIDKNSSLYDSLVAAGSVTDVNVKTEKKDFEGKTIIKADKFVGKKNISIIGYNSNKNSADSLVSTLIDVKHVNGGKITVEFWESPIHFKGYRLGRDKMIVFGISPDDVSLIRHKNDLYLVTINNVYLVKPCSDFCQLRPIKDKAVCADVMSHVN